MDSSPVTLLVAALFAYTVGWAPRLGSRLEALSVPAAVRPTPPAVECLCRCEAAPLVQAPLGSLVYVGAAFGLLLAFVLGFGCGRCSSGRPWGLERLERTPRRGVWATSRVPLEG